ncbi:hypothetical protein BDZ97DRAFT_840683 [Flammula alnicola]|nr:hypothetical protein BDZ97DRAFT_840683 [Flammula alnicola]
MTGRVARLDSLLSFLASSLVISLVNGRGVLVLTDQCSTSSTYEVLFVFSPDSMSYLCECVIYANAQVIDRVIYMCNRCEIFLCLPDSDSSSRLLFLLEFQNFRPYGACAPQMPYFLRKGCSFELFLGFKFRN